MTLGKVAKKNETKLNAVFDLVSVWVLEVSMEKGTIQLNYGNEGKNFQTTADIIFILRGHSWMTSDRFETPYRFCYQNSFEPLNMAWVIDDP